MYDFRRKVNVMVAWFKRVPNWVYVLIGLIAALVILIAMVVIWATSSSENDHPVRVPLFASSTAQPMSLPSVEDVTSTLPPQPTTASSTPVTTTNPSPTTTKQKATTSKTTSTPRTTTAKAKPMPLPVAPKPPKPTTTKRKPLPLPVAPEPPAPDGDGFYHPPAFS